MSETWPPFARHAAKFYDDDEHLHRAIAEFFTQDAHPGDKRVMVARPQTIQGVKERLASGAHGSEVDPDRGIQYFDGPSTLLRMMDGEAFDGGLAAGLIDEFVGGMLAQSQARICFYGEMVDLLCERGDHAAAIEFEALWERAVEREPRLMLLCGYSIERFEGSSGAKHLRAVCRKHSHIIRSIADEPGDRGFEESPPGSTLRPARSQPVYVVDDDISMRRSLGRLLGLFNWNVLTFDSADAFLAEAGKFSGGGGCLLLDIRLLGMDGLELLANLKHAGVPLPVIAMSGEHDEKAEKEALRLGARSFLRKPFEPQQLFEAITRALA